VGPIYHNEFSFYDFCDVSCHRNSCETVRGRHPKNTFPLFSRTFRTRGRHGTPKQCRELSPILIARPRRPAVLKISRHLSTMQTARRKTVHSRVSDYYSLVYCLAARLGVLFEAKNSGNSGNTVFLCRARKHRKWEQPRKAGPSLKVIYPGDATFSRADSDRPSIGDRESELVVNRLTDIIACKHSFVIPMCSPMLDQR
jgi:hypothetical protein